MRNLKRALSLAVASIMLLGLMVVGTGAVSVDDFGDADQIASENQEAVAISVGLGIFAGADGNFLPDQPVTRAEMATIICKLLYGNNVNADNFKGAGTFEDTANYQSGWAEGYINMCASLGIVSGYNESAFGPGDTVTTWQASLMLQRALGYWAEGDSNAINELAVTTRATQLGFYGDLTLGANEPLDREDVAVMVFNAMFAQRVAFDDYRGLYVKANDRNVVVTNGTEDESNTLAQNTYGLYTVEGVVTANGYTDERLSASLVSAAQTRVVFEDAVDLDKDGRATDNDYDFEYETGLDLIGHAVNVYYTIERNAPVVYAIVDDATLVGVIDYDANTTRLAAAANDLGFRRHTILDVDVDDYIINYDFDTTVSDLTTWIDGKTNVKDGNALNGDKKLIVISNSGNLTVDYVIVLDQYLDTIDMIDEDERYGTVDYILDETNRAGDMAVADGDVSEGDYVIVTDIGNQGDVWVLQPATVVSANITKITGISDDHSNVTRITADGDYYYESTVYGGELSSKVFTLFKNITTLGEAALVLDTFGDLVGLAEEAAAPNYAYVAQYGVRHSTTGLNTDYALTAHVYFADGTNGIYEVDLDDSFQTAFNLSQEDLSTGRGTTLNGLNTGYGQNKSGALGLWNVTLQSDDTVRIERLVTSVSGPVADDVRLIQRHSTLLTASGNNVTGFTGAANGPLYQNSETVYFYVNGTYDDDLTVNVLTGIQNAKGFTNDKASGKNVGIQQTFATAAESQNDRNVIDTMLIYGVKLGGSADVYYYDQGNYHTERTEGGIVLVYELYDNDTGEAVEATYDNGGKYFEDAAAAREHAKKLPDGFYKISSDNLEVVYNKTGTVGKVDDINYVINDEARYDEYAKNLFSELVKVGTITDETLVVDICDSGLNSISKIASAIDSADGDVSISYSYDKNYETDVIFVTAYDPDPTQGPGGVVDNGNVSADTTTVNIGGVNFYFTTAYDTIRDAIANASTYNLGGQAGNVGGVNITATSTDRTNSTAGVTTASDANGAVLAAGAMDGDASIAGTVSLRAGDYIVVSVGTGNSNTDIAGYIVIQVVE